MDGNKVASDGVLDPRKGAGRKPEQLEFIFGQQSPSNSDEYHHVQTDLSILSALRPLIARREVEERKKKKLIEKSVELIPVKAEVARLLSEMEKFGVHVDADETGTIEEIKTVIEENEAKRDGKRVKRKHSKNMSPESSQKRSRRS
eukprot:CAMPEP_0182440984 /NCGR_PEP_ID=MMETSP1167-20130531/87419_1 /TAXON_ID=2988 /ORGANISM="Mallomonas Sp, Strain CCMP3275" /LENGTH=145 /DNA_ID=CAMNT_0024635105 /DNA_START=829 /DNA_END=1266 /DNA_ORIENTATION=+